MRKLFVVLVVAIAAFGFGVAACASDVVDVATPDVEATSLDANHATLAKVLAAVVKPDGVDYAALVADHADLDRYRVQLAKATVPAEGDARKALFIDAYNAWTLALVVRLLPEDHALWAKWSFKDQGTLIQSVWKKHSFELGGKRYTLDQVENEVLRPMGDPRIHFTINCASRSCPTLAAEPYRAEKLDAQLDAATTAFVKNTEQVRLEKDKLLLNPILDWFSGDFEKSGGVRKFLLGRVPGGPVKDYLEGDGKLRFFDYDWRLNLAGAGK